MEQTEKRQIQDQLNSLMARYMELKKHHGSPREMKNITNKVYALLSREADNPCSRALHYKLDLMIEINQNTSAAQDGQDVFHECFLNALENYSPERNPEFFPYFMLSVRWYVLDKIYKKNTRVVGRQADGSEKREPVEQPLTLDDPKSVSIPDPAPGPQAICEGAKEKDAEAKAKVASLLANVTLFYEHHTGNYDYTERLRYYRCFTTDYMICFAKEKVFDIISINEQDAFSAMDCIFLDYLMTKECRTLYKIKKTPLKSYAQLGITKKTGTIGLPLEAIVYKDYLSKQYQKKVSDAALSLQRTAFHTSLGIDKHSHSWILPQNEEENV
ncbi:MAG: hypothetical protein K5695_04400 [Oscillospiraceae bacterium]|nr:hypothetical protein [Oscillospiraceae bacterium]